MTKVGFVVQPRQAVARYSRHSGPRLGRRDDLYARRPGRDRPLNSPRM